MPAQTGGEEGEHDGDIEARASEGSGCVLDAGAGGEPEADGEDRGHIGDAGGGLVAEPEPQAPWWDGVWQVTRQHTFTVSCQAPFDDTVSQRWFMAADGFERMRVERTIEIGTIGPLLGEEYPAGTDRWVMTLEGDRSVHDSWKLAFDQIEGSFEGTVDLWLEDKGCFSSNAVFGRRTGDRL